MLIQADAFHLPYLDEIFHACITSPPYWGMRKYSGEQGDEPLGLEEDDQIYIEKLVVAFREVNRVLRPDGVLWVNLGDCYTGGGRGGQSAKKRSSNWQPEYRRVNSKNLPQGSLMLLPHRVALAMQEDGWILRNDNVWWKRNPMPDPVAGWRWERHRLKDENGDWINCQGCEKCLHDNPLHPDLYVPKFGSWRHTRGHEYVFQFVKGMGYYCNQEVVRESMTRKPGLTDPGNRIEPRKEVIEHLQERGSGGHFDGHKWNMNSAGRNPRSVLDVPTTSYSGSHYAVFPPKLIAPLIEASVPRRSCPECGRPWSPVVDRGEPVFGKSSWGLKGTSKWT